MGTNAAKTPPPQAAPSDDGVTDLRAFSLKLSERFPDRFIQRFVMPPNIRECREVFVMEITSREELRAAAMADAMMSPQERASRKLAEDAEKREAIRLSIVGIGYRKGGWRAPETAPVEYRHVNSDDLPFVEINDWSMKAWSALHVWFGQVNGVPMDEIAKGIEEAQTVGAFAPPQKTSETNASADPGR